MGSKKTLVITIFSFFVLIFVLLLFVSFQEEKQEVVFVYGFNQTRSSGVNLTYPPTQIVRNCSNDSQCKWISTNCCGERSGAHWECLNEKTYIDCKSKLVLCPQVVSPKPKIPCKCIDGVCRAVES